MSTTTTTCPHDNVLVETDEDEYGWDFRTYVCFDCGIDLPGDPDEDYADYLANERESE